MAEEVSKKDQGEPFQRSTRLKLESELQLGITKSRMDPFPVDEFENKTHLEPGSMGVEVGVKRGSSPQDYAEEEERVRHKAEVETIRKDLAEKVPMTATTERSRKRRAKPASEIKTAEAALEDATKASSEATSSEGKRVRHKAEG